MAPLITTGTAIYMGRQARAQLARGQDEINVRAWLRRQFPLATDNDISEAMFLALYCEWPRD